jgi:Core-2/I-Branching enzyme
MRLAYIVLAHRAPKQVALLLSALRSSSARLYLHVDRRMPLKPFTRAVSAIGVHDAVVLPRHASRWGGIEVVDATLDGFSRGLADGCEYFVLISGQDFPLRPSDEIVAYLASSQARSYLQYWPVEASVHRFHGRDRTEFYAYYVFGRRNICIPRGDDVSHLNRRGRALNALLRVRTAFKLPRHHPRYARPFMGSAWLNLSRVAVEYILEFVNDHPDYRRYHEHTWVPDEMFFQTILLGTDFANTHEVVGDNLRFLKHGPGYHPRTLVAADLREIIGSRKLFARKFDSEADSDVLAQLAQRVGV